MNIIIKCLIKPFLLVTGVLTVMFGLNSSLWAATCAFDENNPEPFGARYVLRVDAGTTCAEMNMDGCEVSGGSGSCTSDSGMEVTFSIATDGSLSWTSNTPSNIPDAILARGGTQGNGCGYFNPDEYTAGAGLGDLNNKDNYTGIKSAQACTDNKRNPVSQAILQTVKTVTTDGGDCMSAGALLNVDIIDPVVGITVKYCYAISNIGGGDAEISAALDDNGNGFYADCTGMDCVDDDFDPFGPITLGPGETIRTESNTTIKDAGVITNVISVEGTWTDPLDSANVVYLSAEDTATVVARLNVEPCPPDAQTVMDGELDSNSEDGFNFSFFLDSNNPTRSAMCTPSSVTTKGVQCVNECVPRDCETVGCTVPDNTTCEPSGVWNTDYNPATAQTFPYCWEVAMDRDQDGQYKKMSPVKQDTLTVMRRNDNPHQGTYCYSSGGRETCIDYCYPKVGEPDDICK